MLSFALDLNLFIYVLLLCCHSSKLVFLVIFWAQASVVETASLALTAVASAMATACIAITGLFVLYVCVWGSKKYVILIFFLFLFHCIWSGVCRTNPFFYTPTGVKDLGCCRDGQRNQDEDDIDCGGVRAGCTACSTTVVSSSLLSSNAMFVWYEFLKWPRNLCCFLIKLF